MKFTMWLLRYEGDDERVIELKELMLSDKNWPHNAEHNGEIVDYLLAQGYCQHYWDEAIVNLNAAQFDYYESMTGRSVETAGDYSDINLFVNATGLTKWVLMNSDSRLDKLRDEIYEDDTWPINASQFHEIKEYVDMVYETSEMIMNDLSLALLLRYRKDV